MEYIFGTFIRLVITAAFFVLVIIVAIKIGVGLRKKKNLKEQAV